MPLHDDRKLFEFLILEGAQAGLSWIMILKKRQAYRAAFDQFDAQKIARYGPAKVEKLLANSGIVRNRLKINAAVTNASAYLDILDRWDSFDHYIWQFVDGRTQQNKWRELRHVPVSTPASDAMARELKKQGFKFVGSTICYAFMQATGMVNDHTTNCFRHVELC